MVGIIIWGTGEISCRYINKYNKRMSDYVNIVAFIDNDIEKQGTIFYGYPVISYEDIDNYNYDYIVIMNNYVKEIYEQIGKEVENDEIVISLDQLFELYMEKNYWKDKRILFYGEYMNYELAEYRAKYAFNRIQYCKNDTVFSVEDFDFVFLCPPRLMSPYETVSYEEKLRANLKDANVSDEKILSYDEWRHYLHCDQKIQGGKKNGNKKFLIIASSDPMQGWGNILLRVWGGIAYAYSHDMIPVIDMKNLKNQYLPEKLLGKHNAWDDFFEPVSEYDLEEAYESENVILSGIDTHIYGRMRADCTVYKKNISNQINETYKTLFPRNGKILGVVYRGTDYNRAYRHKASGDLDKFIIYIRKYISRIKYDYIFLATEVEEATGRFKEEFGDKVFWVEQERYKSSERRWLYLIHFNRENDELKRGMEYITVLDLLSKCGAIVGPNTGTVRAAIVLNNREYEYVNILKDVNSWEIKDEECI